MKITDSIVLVTGANRGVGRVFARTLIQRGAKKVYVTARDVESLEVTEGGASERQVPLRLDVTSAQDIAAAVRAAGDVNLLINNAGVLSAGGALDVAEAALRRDMAVNFEGLLNVTRTFAPVMESNGGGKVVNMLSLLSLVSAPGFSAYNASKAAAWSIAMSLRAYLEPKGISVLNVFPAGIDTDMLAGVDGPKDDPEAVVADVLDAVESEAEDVYPASAADVHASWRDDPKAVEKAFAAMM
ncbi:SDR family NAD(P)-dependent oxidoreductase [Oricola thermophila]|uniref:SDR family NAD(P)-dependent oxidoreductase n=1 Tax=Oricola thermophila TaxID=2742145 RepID=A0A6N1VLY8_9HYPH|nr:SDR family NAD(P)-dependent oxidoreductase [Oricola thermophila]QKV20442.1 SDR family NAD(P)-dependent oxidoreductase [Oricola thermophila]